MTQPTLWQRFIAWLTDIPWLTGVQPVAPGRPHDGLVSHPAGSDLDKPWADLAQEFSDVRESWRKNPLTRRFVSVTTAYVVGAGLELASDTPALSAFIRRFWAHPENDLRRRQYEMCDELTRAGELFVSLHLNRADGMSYLRLLPAARIDRVDTAPGDYEQELAYHELVAPDDPAYPEGRTWWAAGRPEADLPAPDGRYPPVVLHFAVNRPPGCVRGESDLVPVLNWLRRYSRWLEDRVRLNAAVHAFLWIVRVPAARVETTKEQLRLAPETGAVQVIDKDSEDWQAVAPSLNAADAESDGRALRRMVAAGSLGLALVDFGESDDASLATARAQADLRTRVLASRQAFFGQVLATIALAAYNRAVALGLVAGAPAQLDAIRVLYPDISPADNAELGACAAAVANALHTAAGQGLSGQRWRRLVLRAVTDYAGVAVSDEDVERILRESAAAAAAGQDGED